jgi:hypothetical protein
VRAFSLLAAALLFEALTRKSIAAAGFKNSSQHGIEIRQHLIIIQSQEANALRLDEGLAVTVFFGLTNLTVAIQLDR